MSKLEDALPTTDVLYVTRIQKERFPKPEDYEKVINIINFVGRAFISILIVWARFLEKSTFFGYNYAHIYW